MGRIVVGYGIGTRGMLRTERSCRGPSDCQYCSNRITYLIGEDPILPLGPEISEPVEPRELEGLKLASGFDVSWIFGDFLIGRPGVEGVCYRLAGCGPPRLSRMELLDRLLCTVLDLLVGCSSEIVVSKTHSPKCSPHIASLEIVISTILSRSPHLLFHLQKNSETKPSSLLSSFLSSIRSTVL